MSEFFVPLEKLRTCSTRAYVIMICWTMILWKKEEKKTLLSLSAAQRWCTQLAGAHQHWPLQLRELQLSPRAPQFISFPFVE